MAVCYTLGMTRNATPQTTRETTSILVNDLGTEMTLEQLINNILAADLPFKINEDEIIVAGHTHWRYR